jgi:hypothetical protein
VLVAVTDCFEPVSELSQQRGGFGFLSGRISPAVDARPLVYRSEDLLIKEIT